MTVNLTLLVVMGVMYSVGVYLLLERSMTRVLLGIMLLTNATNLLILHAGGAPDSLRSTTRILTDPSTRIPYRRR